MGIAAEESPRGKVLVALKGEKEEVPHHVCDLLCMGGDIPDITGELVDPIGGAGLCHDGENILGALGDGRADCGFVVSESNCGEICAETQWVGLFGDAGRRFWVGEGGNCQIATTGIVEEMALFDSFDRAGHGLSGR